MFGDSLRMGDTAIIRLQCAHNYSGAEMRCINCNQLYMPESNKMQFGIAVEDFDYTDALDW